jgi:hypothetical protein
LIMEALDHAARMPAEIETPRVIGSRTDH